MTVNEDKFNTLNMFVSYVENGKISRSTSLMCCVELTATNELFLSLTAVNNVSLRGVCSRHLCEFFCLRRSQAGL